MTPADVALTAALIGVAVLGLIFTRRYYLRGWGALSDQFPDQTSVFGESSNFSSVSIRPPQAWFTANYNLCANVLVSELGLRLSTAFPFHRPMFIPWSEVVSVVSPGLASRPRSVILKVRGFEGEIIVLYKAAERVLTGWTAARRND